MIFGFEIGILRFLQDGRTDFLNKVFELITMLGEETLFIVILAIIYFAFSKKYAQKVLFIIITSMGLNGIIKNFAKVPRPFSVEGGVECVRPETATGYSFPSGHTQTVATWSTAFAIKLKKHWFTILTVLAIALVAFSRCYLGAHYPSDVIVGAGLGIGMAFLGSFIYDKVPNKKTLFLIVTCAFIPFAVFFLFSNNYLTADFYKMYGLLAGFTLAIGFEEKYVNFDCKEVWWKRVIRVVIALGIAIGLKSGLKVVFNLINIDIWVTLILDFIRYFLLAFVTLGVYPLIFKKLKF